VLSLANRLAADSHCLLVGTEHLLLALLAHRSNQGQPTRAAAWLADNAGPAEALAASAREIAATTAGAATNDLRSRSLARGLELACLAMGEPVMHRHVLKDI
jgi:hypothetical protein